MDDRLPRPIRPAIRRVSSEIALRAGKALFYQGDRADRAYLVHSGELRRTLYRSNESTAELGRAGPGDWLGLAELMLESVYLVDAVAETGSMLLAFSRQGVLRLLDGPGAAAYLVEQLSRQLYLLHTRVEVSLPRDRTIRFLAEKVAAGSLTIACTQEEIAAAVGLTRETVNRHLSQLQAQGLIRVSRGELTVVVPGAFLEGGDPMSPTSPGSTAARSAAEGA